VVVGNSVADERRVDETLLQVNGFSLHDENVSNAKVRHDGKQGGKHRRTNGEGQCETESQTSSTH
jgi:hypothetical protein